MGIPVELVSRFMGHASTSITERVYARVREDPVADRMLDAIDPTAEGLRGLARGTSASSRP
jgi:hypothetical protein